MFEEKDSEMRLPAAALAAALYALAGAAAAQTVVPKPDAPGHKGDMARLAQEKAMAKFAAIDANKDDKLSREEVAKLQYLADNFDKRDADKDGFLSWREYVGHDRWPR